MAAVVPRPTPVRGLDIARLIPSGRTAAVTIAVAVIATLLYLLARETSLFAVQRVDVRGASPSVAASVRDALEPFAGASLVTLDRAAVERRLAALPVVASARYDRDFPHTLKVFVRAERPVVVLRRGSEAWLISARSRVMQRLQPRAHPTLPRFWVRRSVSVGLGETVAGDAVRAVAAAAPIRGTPLADRVRSVRVADGDLTLVLRSGLELRLEDARNLPLKLAVASRVANVMGEVRGYVDLGVPGRPVAAVNPQLEG